MYYRQVMLAPLLTVKQNVPMTLSKHEANLGEENKEAEIDHALSVSQMLWNCLKNSREFL